MLIDSPNVRRLRPWWSLCAATLLLAGLAGGYFLPLGSPTADAPDAALGIASNGDSTGDAIVQSTKPPRAGQTPATREFALSDADVRDMQEAPTLAIDARGRVCLAWASKTSDLERTLFVAVSSVGSGFSGPREVRKSGIFKSQSKGKSGGFERRMVPLVAAFGDTMLLAWNEAPPDGATIRMMLASTHDGGQTFSEPVCVHQSDAARPTFSSLAVNAHGRAVCAWLDSRHGPQQVFAAVRAATDEAFAAEAEFYGGERAAGVCPCCPTAAAVSEKGETFVAFRNDLDGYRDIWLTKMTGREAALSETFPVTAPRWQFDGCPHDGPSLAILNGQVHVVWMDAHSGTERVYYGRAPLDTLQFEVEPLHSVGPGTQGNAKLCADQNGRLHAVWEESLADEPAASAAGATGRHGIHQHGPPTGTGRVIMHAVATHADGRFSAAVAIAPRPKRFQTRPAIACGEAGMVVAWNELDESGKRVVVTRIADFPTSQHVSKAEVGR
ncbi:MAG TPA: hypothetical protein VFI31_19485 [Pirellulales bacterium]|nr:hypothetical protein [Pirellulales bacterium]